MRPIKFRQWVKDRFYYWGVGVDDCTFVGPASGGRINADNTDHQQFTGFIDKHGKEIWEGDLMIHPDFAKNTVLTVKFSDGCFDLSGWDCVRTDFSKGEVIGNIYQDSHLLTSKE